MDLVCQRFWPTLCNELAKQPLFQGLGLFVIGPFLGQHNVPCQWDELWLNLEERTMSQLWVCLFENSVIKGRRWINIRLLFEMRNVARNLVLDCTDPLWVDAKRQVNQQLTEETSKHLPNFDRLHVWSVQDRAEELSVTLRISGWGSSVTGDVQTTWRAAKIDSWLSPSQTQVRWFTRAYHHCCCSWFVVYAEPLHPGNDCATRIPGWWKIVQHLPTNYLWLSLQRAFKELNGQYAFPIWCLNQAWACCKRNRFCNAWFCWCCTDKMHDGSVLPHASWRKMYAGQGPYKE